MALDIIAWHDRITADHQQNLNSAAAKGYRTLSLSIYGDRNDPRYAAVMIKRPVVIATEQRFGMTAAQFQAAFNDMAAKKWGPYLVTATGPTNDPLFAAVFTPMDAIPLTRFNLTAQELDQLNDDQMQHGGILRSVDSYGSPGDVRYTAVWFPNPDRVSWNCDAITDDAATVQQRFNAITSVGGRPTIAVMDPDGRFLELFVDTTVGAWSARGNLTSDRYQAEFNKNMSAGLAPLFVSGQGTSSNARFTAIFADSETVQTRTFRAAGPTTVPEIDAAMESFMRKHNTRNVSLAIVKGTRLVYAKGYTWAEPNFPSTQPTTLFRQASVSKTLAALATYRLFEQNTAFTLDTTMQSVLNLTTPTGGQPTDPRFNQVTIRHLLESTSAINRWGMWQDIETAKAFGGLNKLPVSPQQLARYIASQPLEGQDVPGDTHNVKYNNTGYFMLSQVVARMRGAASFEAALQDTLFKPLNITRIRQSTSLLNVQAADEARYQQRYAFAKNDKGETTTYQRAFGVAQSVRTPDRLLVPNQYGGWSSENIDGAGGISAAATDLARILAAFSLRTKNPMLKPETIDGMLSNAAFASQHYSGEDKHGFHGFDSVDVVDAVKHIYHGGKGGWLPASDNAYEFTTGGFAYVACEGTNGFQGETADWGPTVKSIAENHDWGSTDLFPLFGMPSFNEPKPAMLVGDIEPHLSPTRFIDLQPKLTLANTPAMQLR